MTRLRDQEYKPSAFVRFVLEARRRHVFRVAALYIVGAWLALQVADVLFPSFGIPDVAIQILLYAAALGFPVALIFGWMFDVGREGIRRTPPVGLGDQSPSLALRGSDYTTLAALGIVAILIVYNATRDVIEIPVDETSALDLADPGLASAQILPNSVAVLPFANISGDPDNEFFCDGISEEILNRLADFSELNVPGRTSSFFFKGKEVTIPKIAALLGVQYLLQGSVRRYGDQLRISTQLLDASGVQIWSDDFDREMHDVFAMQTEIAEAVAKNVAPQVAPVFVTGAIPDLKAYEHYLNGRELLHLRNTPAARLELQEAIDIDADFAEAYAELAIPLLIGFPSDEDIEAAQAHINTALSITPRLPRAQAAQGLLYMQQPSPDYAAAEAILRNVLLQDSHMSDAMLWLSTALGLQGREDESQSILERAARIDPLHPVITLNLANRLISRGDVERGAQMLFRLLEVSPRSTFVYLPLVTHYGRKGQFLEAIEILKREALNLAATSYFHLAKTYAELGNWEASEYWLQRSKVDLPNYFSTPFFDATLPWWQGRYTEGVSLYKLALESNEIVLAKNDSVYSHWLGWMQGPANDHESTIRTLQPALDSTRPPQQQGTLDIHASQALAWAYLETGQADKAEWIIDGLDRYFSEADEDGVLAGLHIVPFYDARYRYALNTRLMGQHDLALDRLEQAIEFGWRDYYVSHHDSRWNVLRNNPRFKELMAFVKADVDAQRAEQGRIDAEDGFIAKLDAAIAAAAQE